MGSVAPDETHALAEVGRCFGDQFPCRLLALPANPAGRRLLSAASLVDGSPGSGVTWAKTADLRPGCC